MSMHPEPDNFEQLRRLLSLKRHEQPPPDYFNHFSREVIVRIRSAELQEQSAAGFLLEFPLLQRIWATLEARPVLAGAFGVALCGFLTAGFLFSDNSTTVQTGGIGALMTEGNQMTPAQFSSQPATPFLSQAPGIGLSSTGGVGVLRASLFHQPQAQARLVNFNP
jgi:hypothetical protein